MKRKFLVMLLALASALCICFGIAACGPADDEESSAEVWTIERVYARATDLGFSGSLDDLIAAFKGDPGKDGVGIKRIYINEKGALIIELTEGEPIDLGVIRGTNGEDGTDGQNGKDGVTPHVGENGHWFIGEQDTGIKAEGTDGKDGVDGKDGINGTNGKDGKSAYDIWKENGHSGTEEEFLEWLRGTSKEAECSLHFALNHDRESYTVVGIGMYEDVDLVIPAQYKGKAVTAIAACAFQGLQWFESVEIPASVKTIGEGAFNGCRLLQSVTLEGDSQLTSIEGRTFMACDSLQSVTFEGDSQLTSIGSSAFSGCSSLESITIPEGVTSIEEGTFRGCSKLQSVTIPASVTSIERRILEGGAFEDCNSLNAVHITDLEAWCGIDFGGVDAYSGDVNPLYYAHHLYVDGREVTDLHIPDGVTEIKRYAFNGGAFTSVIISVGVTSVGSEAFGNCGSLTSVTISEGVTSIGGWAFWNCDSLETIEVAQGNPVYHSDGNCLIETDSQTLIAGCKSSVIPSDGSVTSIGNGAFVGCDSLTSITIPEGVISIEDRAFVGCSSLTSVVIPVSVTSIEGSAFEECESIQKVYYGGTKEGWDMRWSGRPEFFRATHYFFSGGKPSAEQWEESPNWWHFDAETGEVIEWKQD